MMTYALMFAMVPMAMFLVQEDVGLDTLEYQAQELRELERVRKGHA